MPEGGLADIRLPLNHIGYTDQRGLRTDKFRHQSALTGGLIVKLRAAGPQVYSIARLLS
jgi:hypothetical protein